MEQQSSGRYPLETFGTFEIVMGTVMEIAQTPHLSLSIFKPGIINPGLVADVATRTSSGMHENEKYKKTLT